MGGAIHPLTLHDFMVCVENSIFFFKQVILGGTIKFCYVTSEHIARCNHVSLAHQMISIYITAY